VKDLDRQCVRVLTNDRIGVYNINSTGVVPYRFEHDAQTYVLRTEPVEQNQEVAFDTLDYPYAFGVAAYSVDSSNGRLTHRLITFNA